MKRTLNGGITIKRSLTAVMAVILVLLLSACGSHTKSPVSTPDKTAGNDIAAAASTSGNTAASGSTASQGAQQGTAAGTEPQAPDNTNQSAANEQLLQSASVDLNDDGVSEQVEAVQITTGKGADNDGELEGRLKIKSGSKESQISFWKKSGGTTGILSGIQFEDLDGDGTKDIFIIIPDHGASFSYSNYFIYSFKKNISYAFTSNNELVDFIDGFAFKYKNKNILSLVNDNYGFSTDLAIENASGQESPEDYMSEYERRAWVEPVSDDISESSKLALVKTSGGRREIKVPLPIFGLGTVDMIGEMDLYYSVDSSFNPVLKRFEVIDFNGSDRVKTGSCELK